MKRSLVLLGIVIVLVAACAPQPTLRYPGRYDRYDHVYTNESLGFRLTFPQQWAVATSPQFFTVPLALRSDQEQVLEAYDPLSKLGLIIVVQQGPVADIAQLVQRMRATPVEQLGEHLIGPNMMDVQQHSLRRITVQGQDVVEWVYTARDTTGTVAVTTTVSFFMLKVHDHLVYFTFASPETQYASTKPTIEAILQTFGLVNGA